MGRVRLSQPHCEGDSLLHSPVTQGWGELQGWKHRTADCRAGSSPCRENIDAEGTLVCEYKRDKAVQTSVHVPQSTKGCSCLEFGFPQAPKGPGMDRGERPRSPSGEGLPPSHTPPAAITGHTLRNPTDCPAEAGSAVAARTHPKSAPCPEANPLGTSLTGEPRSSLS